jgi:hypothetical protein
VAARGEQWRERHRHPPRAQRVGLERLAHDVEIGGQDALPRVVVDRGVVHQHVELAGRAPERADRALIRHVEPHRAQVGVGHRVRVARAREHGEPARRELAGDLQPDPAVGTGDKSRWHSTEATDPPPRHGQARRRTEHYDYEEPTSDCAALDSSRMTSACADAGALAGGEIC